MSDLNRFARLLALRESASRAAEEPSVSIHYRRGFGMGMYRAPAGVTFAGIRVAERPQAGDRAFRTTLPTIIYLIGRVLLLIAEVWFATFGEQLHDKRRSGPDQVRVVCPFHADHSPSCDVNLKKDVFLCRSCGAKGGYLDVLIHAGLVQSRRDAAAWIERRGLRRPC